MSKVTGKAYLFTQDSCKSS